MSELQQSLQCSAPCGFGCRYNKILMIDRRFYGSEAPNPTYIVAAEYDIANNAVRNVTGTSQAPLHFSSDISLGCW